MTDCTQQCNCNCGTRICLDEQLIEERQTWKEKYHCLQKQSARDIGLLKERIYQECSTLMQKEFSKKESESSEALNRKSVEIQELTSRVIKLETALKVSQRENEILKDRLKEEEDRYNEKLEEIGETKSKHNRHLNLLEEQNLSETNQLRIRIGQENEEIQKKLENENEHLKHKVQEFEKKYQSIIPEVEKLKNTLTKRCSEISQLEGQLEKIKQIREKENDQWRVKYDEAVESYSSYPAKMSSLTEKISDLEKELQKAKNVKREVKIEPVYVDRPVEVERVVEKIVEVQRFVKQYIEPEHPSEHEVQNKKLRQELNSLVGEIQLFEGRHETVLKDHQNTVDQLEANIEKFKAEREQLIGRINEQEQELERIYEMLMAKDQAEGHNPERIVVQVAKDGSYNKRVEKMTSGERVNVQTSGSSNQLKGTVRDGHGQMTSSVSGRATKPILKRSK